MPDEQTLFACLRRGAAAKRVADSSLRDPPFVVSPEQFGEVVTCFGPIQGTPTNPLSILDRVCVCRSTNATFLAVTNQSHSVVDADLHCGLATILSWLDQRYRG